MPGPMATLTLPWSKPPSFAQALLRAMVTVGFVDAAFGVPMGYAEVAYVRPRIEIEAGEVGVTIEVGSLLSTLGHAHHAQTLIESRLTEEHMQEALSFLDRTKKDYHEHAQIVHHIVEVGPRMASRAVADDPSAEILLFLKCAGPGASRAHVRGPRPA